MKLFTCAVFLIVANLAFAAESDVVDLTDSDFDTLIKDYPTALVMFYAPWCGEYFYSRHCTLKSYHK
jgi:hypothetical protein